MIKTVHKLSQDEWKEFNTILEYLKSDDDETIELGLGLLKYYPQNIIDQWTFNICVIENLPILTLGRQLERIQTFFIMTNSIYLGLYKLIDIVNSICMDQRYYLIYNE